MFAQNLFGGTVVILMVLIFGSAAISYARHRLLG